MLFMYVRALSYKQFIHVIARTVPLTFKLTKVKMHKTRWGNGLQARHYKGQDTARYICIESSLQIPSVLLERSIVILHITMKFVVFDTIHPVIFCISTINQLTYINLKTLYGWEFKGKNVEIGTIFSSHEPRPRTKKHSYLLSFNILYYFLRHFQFICAQRDLSNRIYAISLRYQLNCLKLFKSAIIGVRNRHTNLNKYKHWRVILN